MQSSDAQAEQTGGRLPFFDRPVRVSLGWLVLILIFALEWAFLAQYAKRELVGAYPLNIDQSTYLSQAYEVFERTSSDGLVAGVLHALLMKPPQGTMLHLQSGLWMLAAGPGRLGAYSFHFAYFVLLQIAFVYTLLWLSGRWAAAFLGLGLLLCTTSRFLPAGGMVDFRLDHIAFCLFGVFLCLAIRSGVFASWPWSLAAGAAGGMLILFRYQAALTLAASMVLLLVILLVMAWRGRDGARRAAMMRVRGLLWSGLVTSMMVLPALWFARRELRTYYWADAVSRAGIRRHEYGAAGTFEYWSFYPRSLLLDHLGAVFCLLAVLAVVALFAASRLRREENSAHPPAVFPISHVAVLAATMLLAPMVVLAGYPVRNPVVADILICPALMLVMCAVIALAGRAGPGTLPGSRRTLGALAALVLICGLLNELTMAARRTYLTNQRDSVRTIVQIYDEIAQHALHAGWTSPVLSFDRIEDFFCGAHIGTLAFERQGVLLRGSTSLGRDVMATEPARVVEALRNSDFLIISAPANPPGPGFDFPFNSSMRRMRPQLEAAANRYMTPVKGFHAFDRDFALYMRPPVRVLGVTDGWITSRGLTLSAPADEVRARPNIEISGTTILAEHLGNPGIKARLTGNARKPGEIPLKFELSVVPRGASHYKALLYLDPNRLAGGGDVEIEITFEKFLVPKNIGFNADTRKLVVQAPQRVALLP